MANGDGDDRPRSFTAATAWEAFDRLRDDTNSRLDRILTESREARHSQNNQFARVIADESKETREVVAGVDARVRALETAIATNTPTSLGERTNKLETWRAVADGQTNLPARIDAIEDEVEAVKAGLNVQRAEFRGGMRVVKAGIAAVGLIATVVPIVLALTGIGGTP